MKFPHVDFALGPHCIVAEIVTNVTVPLIRSIATYSPRTLFLCNEIHKLKKRALIDLLVTWKLRWSADMHTYKCS